MTTSTLTLGASEGARTMPAIVDCDVHTMIPGDALRIRLSPRWRDYLDQFGLRAPKPNNYFPTRPRKVACRHDSWPPEGGPPGSNPSFASEQLLDAWDIDIAILNPIEAIDYGSQVGPFASALTSAVNDWIREEWLDTDTRYRAAITVPFEEPELAVAEISRLAPDSRFAHILLLCRTREPLGHWRYWPLFEAAQAYDLPIAVHVGGLGNNGVTGAGWPSFYIEDHLGMGNAMHNQVISLVLRGTFERFPRLRVVLEEACIGWLAPLMWNLDEAWTLLREESKTLERPPSEYIREHFWITTQPIEEPEDPADLLSLIEFMDMDDRVMFATDYPHWDFDAPTALPRGLTPEKKAAILGRNAVALYRFTK